MEEENKEEEENYSHLRKAHFSLGFAHWETDLSNKMA